ncbi:MAG: hypothetical protein KatS3mg087_1306 [Patescibacteria group bacterium]|nr:MAG: hypothetical protein KatS3mg087_1306 [Patescibacteria group bacterium]
MGEKAIIDLILQITGIDDLAELNKLAEKAIFNFNIFQKTLNKVGKAGIRLPRSEALIGDIARKFTPFTEEQFLRILSSPELGKALTNALFFRLKETFSKAAPILAHRKLVDPTGVLIGRPPRAEDLRRIAQRLRQVSLKEATARRRRVSRAVRRRIQRNVFPLNIETIHSSAFGVQRSAFLLRLLRREILEEAQTIQGRAGRPFAARLARSFAAEVAPSAELEKTSRMAIRAIREVEDFRRREVSKSYQQEARLIENIEKLNRRVRERSIESLLRRRELRQQELINFRSRIPFTPEFSEAFRQQLSSSPFSRALQFVSRTGEFHTPRAPLHLRILGMAFLGSITGQAISNAVQEASQLANVEATFRRLPQEQAVPTLRAVQEAAGGALTTFESKKFVSRLLIGGLNTTKEEIGELTKKFIELARVQGFTAVEATERLAKAILEFNKEAVDQIVTGVQFREALDKVTAALSAQGIQVTEAMKRQIAYREVLRVTLQQHSQLTDVTGGVQVLQASWERLNTKIRELRQDLIATFANHEAFFQSINKLVKVISDNKETVIDLFKFLANILQVLVEYSKEFLSIWVGVKTTGILNILLEFISVIIPGLREFQVAKGLIALAGGTAIGLYTHSALSPERTTTIDPNKVHPQLPELPYTR